MAEQIAVRERAADVLELMLRESPLVRLYEHWEQRQHSIPSYVERVESGHVPEPIFLRLRKRLVAGDMPTTDDGYGLFDVAMRTLHERIVSHLDVGLLVEQPKVEYA